MSAGVAALISRWLLPASAHAAASMVLSALLANALLSTLFALLTHALLPHRLRGRAALNIPTLAGFGCLLPLLGPLLLLIIGLAYPHLEKSRRRPQPKVVPRPTYAAEARGHFSRFGAGGALARLRAAAPESEHGSRALLAIASRRARETTALLNEALSHPDETLRLLAHNLLARREEAIVTQISRLEARRGAHGPDTAQTNLDLVELHLEFLYLGIAGGSLRQMHIDAAQQLIEAIGEPPEDAAWRIRLLLARARLNQQRLPAACEPDISQDCEQALGAGAAPARGLPWLLDNAWRERDYARLRGLFEQYPLYRHIPLIGPVAARWGFALDA